MINNINILIYFILKIFDNLELSKDKTLNNILRV